MRLRHMVAAFLINEGEEILFLQKPQNAFLGGYLVPIGGHMEPKEMNEPLKACLREIEEETGLKKEFITDLKFKYVVSRMKLQEEIRIQYVYFGHVSKDVYLTESDEGELQWIDCRKIVTSKVTATTKKIMKHYLEEGRNIDKVYTGAMNGDNNEASITWGVLEDWEINK